ncbi:MAG: PRC-barrel domain-containing protein [Alphaproteobacteria bacterium]|nr:PRC-barrel domain-containing protein [Alphaproteobacteria bacterium]
MRASAAIALLLCFFGIVVLTYVLYNEAFDNEVLEEPRPALAYDTAAATPEQPPENVLNEMTGVLGLTVYGADNEVLGILYDVYADPQTGEVKWISVNIEETRTEDTDAEAELILVSVGEVEEFSDAGPIVVNASTNEFFDWPYQKKHEDKLENLVSLRTLPESPIRDIGGQLVGTVERVSFADNALYEIYFEAVEPGFRGRTQIFAAPFAALNINVAFDQTTQNTEITLTERQAGAIDAYLADE